MSKVPDNLIYAPISASDVQAAHAIEVLCFPPDEAATLDKFEYRQAQAPDLFLGCFIQDGADRTLIGYVCSTLSQDDSLTHESMSQHDAAGTSVCIHAVCVTPQYRRRGIALALLKEYISRLQRAREQGAAYERVLLITHDDMRSLYEKAGFEWLGQSKVVHGSRPWYEMRKVLAPPTSSSAEVSVLDPEPHGLPPNINIWEALQRATTSRSVPVGKLLSAFEGGIKDVTDSVPNSSALTNKHDLLCPRPQCGSIILKSKVATLVERESVVLEPEGAQSPLLPPFPTPPTPVSCWRITPNAMAFENIGFSRSITSTDGQRLKLLSCAECDLGPLGWCVEGGSEFWLVSDRVGYRT